MATALTNQQPIDWRVVLSLAPSANYLYKDADIAEKPDAILYPLIATEGVVFPYTPTISMSYSANYDSQDLTHTNYKLYQYRNSEVGAISLSADFTAQDIYEAKYILAMMFFFKSVTKMFYGEKSGSPNPFTGAPPPVCYLSGYGPYQFNQHPVLVNSFSFQLPADVDYLRVVTDYSDTSGFGFTPKSAANARLKNAKLNLGAEFAPPDFKITRPVPDTFVPSKLSITLQLLPLISRRDMANSFNLADYARGDLNGQGRTGGIW